MALPVILPGVYTFLQENMQEYYEKILWGFLCGHAWLSFVCFIIF